MAKAGFQIVDREFFDKPFVDRLMEAGNLSRIAAGGYIALLCNVLMSEARDGLIAKVDKDWIAERCCWDSDSRQFFDILHRAGLLSVDERGKPYRIEHLDELIGERLAEYDAKAQYMRSYRNDHRNRDAEEQRKKQQTSTVHPPQSIGHTPKGRDDDVGERKNYAGITQAEKVRRVLTAKGINCDVERLIDDGFEPGALLWVVHQSWDGGAHSQKRFDSIIEELWRGGRLTLTAIKDKECNHEGDKRKFENRYKKYRNLDTITVLDDGRMLQEV